MTTFVFPTLSLNDFYSSYFSIFLSVWSNIWIIIKLVIHYNTFFIDLLPVFKYFICYMSYMNIEVLFY